MQMVTYQLTGSAASVKVLAGRVRLGVPRPGFTHYGLALLLGAVHDDRIWLCCSRTVAFGGLAGREAEDHPEQESQERPTAERGPA